MTEVPGELRDTPRSRGRRDSSRISPVVRITGLVLGFALAIAATLAVFLTDNAVYLRLAVIAVAWAFVIAAFSAGRRKTDQAVAEGRESELRQAYALELEREVAARREYELKLENQLRRETQEAMRAELDKLRADLASLAGLRDQLTGLGELQADMGRLRAELTEQLSGEMLVERIVMRTQSIRMPAERAELATGAPLAIDGALHDWTDEPVHHDDVRPRVVPPPPVAPVVDRGPVVHGGPVVDREPAVDRGPDPADVPLRPVEPTSPPGPARPDVPVSRHVSPTQEDRVARTDAAARHTAEQPRVVLPPVAAAAEPVAEPPAPPAPARPAPVPEPPAVVGPSTALWETPAGDDERPHRRRAPEEPPPPPAPPLHEPDVFETAGHQRLTEILAESGATLGGRRRRRYRDDDGDEDDVLARVLDNR